jgi:general bacterial porin, GBP family
MKKQYIAGGVAALFCVACHAQSSVTLYGLISVGVEYVSNEAGHSNLKMLSGSQQGSRWGFKVREELGGGLAAVAQLENGFDVTNGRLMQGGREFGRQAFVGLAHKRFGTVLFGRQTDTFWDILTPFYGASAGSSLNVHVGDNDNIFGDFRYSNAVKYISPTFAGFLGEAMYAFSNQAGGFGNNRAAGLGLLYQQGPVAAGLAFMSIDRPGTANSDGAVTNDYSAAPFQLFHTSPLNATVGVDRQQQVGGGASYQFSQIALYANVTRVRFDYLDSTALRLMNYDVTAVYKVNPSLFAAVGYVFTEGNYSGASVANPHWNMGQVSLDYFLSKRTDVYVYGVIQKATSTTAQIVAQGKSSSALQSLVLAGIRTRF